jgi:hypothetical protein
MIGSFRSSTDLTATVALKYVRSVNQFESEYDLTLLKENPARPLDARKFLNPSFSSEAIRVRIRTFNTIKEYGQLLASLADSDAPDHWKAASARTKSSAESLLKSLTVNPKLKGLPILESAAGALSPLKMLVDVIGTEMINAKRSEALSAAIKKASPAITKISGALSEDIAFVEKQRDSVNLLSISNLSLAYGNAQRSGNNSKRLSILKNFEKALDSRLKTVETMQGLRQALNGFDASHDALVAYAQSKKGPQNLSDLAAVVQHYAGTAKDLFDAFVAIEAGAKS